MADKLVLAFGIPAYDGEYDFDLEEKPFTILEWRWIKKVSGYLPATVSDGAHAGDPDLYLAFAIVALVRGGKVQKDYALLVAEKLAETPFDGTAIQFQGDGEAEEADAFPPSDAQTTPRDGGPPGRTISVLPVSLHEPTGALDSGTYTDAVPGTLTA